MSTKTTFKRIALVAVAALGLGVLSVAPSSAAILTQSLTLASATTTSAVGETNTAVLAEAFYSTLAADSVTVTGVITSSNASKASVELSISATSDSSTTSGAVTIGGNRTSSLTLSSSGTNKTTTANITAKLVSPSAAGTYTVTFYVQRSANGAALGEADTAVVTWSTVVAAANTAATAASKAIVRDGGAALSDTKADSTTVATKTSTGAAGYTVYVLEVNSAATYANESITAVISGNGYISSSATRGTETALTLVNQQDADGTPIYVFSNGTAGAATLTISTPSYTFPAKTLKFSGSATKIANLATYAPKSVIYSKAGT